MPRTTKPKGKKPDTVDRVFTGIAYLSVVLMAALAWWWLMEATTR